MLPKRILAFCLFLLTIFLCVAPEVIGQDTGFTPSPFQLCQGEKKLIVNDQVVCYQWHLGPYPGINWGGIKEWSPPYHNYGEKVIIAILDTGIKWHRDLNKEQFEPGYDLVENPGQVIQINSTDDSRDLNGHGTHIAGIIAQNTNNDRGAAGIAYNAKLMPIRISKDGNIDLETLAKGIRVTAEKAKIINLSLGEKPIDASEEFLVISEDSVQKLKEAIDYAYQKGAIIIAAAGNIQAGQKIPGFMSSLLSSEKVITVAAHNKSGYIAKYSNRANGVDITAPGGENTSAHSCNPFRINELSIDGVLQWVADKVTQQGNIEQGSICSGTSQAAAQVSAIAAIVIDEFQKCSRWLEKEETKQNCDRYSLHEIREIILNPERVLYSYMKFLEKENHSEQQQGKEAVDNYSTYVEFLTERGEGNITEEDVKIRFQQGIPQLNAYTIEWASYAYITMRANSFPLLSELSIDFSKFLSQVPEPILDYWWLALIGLVLVFASIKFPLIVGALVYGASEFGLLWWLTKQTTQESPFSLLALGGFLALIISSLLPTFLVILFLKDKFWLKIARGTALGAGISLILGAFSNFWLLFMALPPLFTFWLSRREFHE